MNIFYKIGIAFIFIIIIGIVIYIKYPLKKALHIDIEYVDKLDITGDENRLFCINTTVTGPTWGVIGINNKILNDYRNNTKMMPKEMIILEGNTEIGVDINDSYGNVFIYDGKFLESKKQDGQLYKVFQISEWNILYPIKINGLFHSDNALTPIDFSLAKKSRN
ncbi:MAG: hypothetical protein ABF289_02295 [Clostridiales bacterium]